MHLEHRILTRLFCFCSHAGKETAKRGRRGARSKGGKEGKSVLVLSESQLRKCLLSWRVCSASNANFPFELGE